MNANTTWLLFGLVLATMGAWSLPAEEPGEHDEWHVFVEGETRYGSQHIRCRTRSDGNFDLEIETRLLIEFLGARQALITQFTGVVTKDFVPDSLHVVHERASGRVVVTAKTDEDQLILTREGHGVSRTVKVDRSSRPILQPLLSLALARAAAAESNVVGTELRIPVLDEESLTVERARCRLLTRTAEGQAEWSVEIGDDEPAAQGRVVVRAGTCLRQEFSAPRYATRVATADEAGHIGYLGLSGRSILAFDIDRPIARPDQLASLSVKLRWKQVPWESFQLRDARQSVVTHTSEGDNQEVVVHIAPPDDTRSPVESLSDQDYAALTGRSQFIDPTHAAIIATARDWTKGSANAQSRVTDLARHVYEQLQGGQPIAETLSGPEVLECKKGKCSEYSVLFASLARSLGIPTRIVLGERMAGDKWIGHMWNEVFLEASPAPSGGQPRQGRWIPVDSTTQEVGWAPGLLKLTHSHSVAGTQPLRWALVDSLEISIVEHTRLPISDSPSWQTGVHGNTYTHAEFGFQVSVPDARWKIAPDAKAGHVVIRLHVPDHEHVLVHCVAFSLPLPMPEPVMLTLRKARFQSTYTDYAVLREQVEAIEGHNWHTLAFARAMLPPEVKVHPAGSKMKTTEYLLHRDKVGYLINLIAAETDHDAYQDAVRNIVASVSFAGDAAQPANAATAVEVRTPDELRRAVRQLQPGTTLKIGPGDYPGGHSVSGLAGLTIAALDPEQPPHFRGGGNAWHFSRCPGLTLSNLRISGQTGNGLNLDDGGELGRPVTGVTIERVEVRDIGPKGNHDGIKCSGLDELTIRDCVLEGWGGQGIDMVGCHDVRISGCKFRGKAGFTATAAVQTKGGSSDVTVEKCHFFQAGERPLNVGGSTGLAYFRPQGVPHEAARITVRDNVIEGSPCAVAFVGVDSAEFTGNLILYPEKWIFRILQETRQEPFVPCRNVRVADNRIVFRRCQVAIEVNVGDGTAPETFRFERNRWFAEDRPDSSRPRLPVAEQDGQYGADPR